METYGMATTLHRRVHLRNGPLAHDVRTVGMPLQEMDNNDDNMRKIARQGNAQD